MKVDYSISLLGEPCPYPAIVANEEIKHLKDGEVLEIISDCPQSINAIPFDMRALGHSCKIVVNGAIIGFYIQKNGENI